jgi:site-specific DNA-adenine methylase
MDARVARGSSIADDPSEGHISVMIPYPTYRRILAYLAAIRRSLEPEELIASILEVPEHRVERAVRFWYAIRSAFGAHPRKGWTFQRARPRTSAAVVQNALANVRAIHERLKTVEIDHLEFRRCIKNRDAPSTFMFLDPPYLDTENYRVGDFSLQDHCDLAAIVANFK